MLSTIIKNYKQNNIRATSYNEFQKQYGQDITDFIVTSMIRISNIDNHNNNKNIYLYEKNKIIKTELSEQKNNKIKIKKRVIN